MAKITNLYPPVLPAQIPPFILSFEQSSQEIIRIKIPFFMNPSVSWTSIKGFSLLIKTVYSNDVIGYFEPQSFEAGTSELIFNIPRYNQNRVSFYQKQYYKFQLAYIDNNGEIGYYSQPAIGRCIDKPEIFIMNYISEDTSGQHQQTIDESNTFRGVFNPLNSGEYLVQSRMKLIDAKTGNLLYDSDFILYDHINDTNDGLSIQTYYIPYNFNYSDRYNLSFTVITDNEYEATITVYNLMKQPSCPVLQDVSLKVINNYDEALNELFLVQPNSPELITGSFRLLRSSSKDNFQTWEIIKYFDLFNQNIQNYKIYNDFYVEYGVNYLYAVQQYNSFQVYSAKIVSNMVQTNFEDMFLVDDEHSLKMRFNPKVTGFKRNLLSQKVQTLGGKYPFIFHSGDTDYSEFTINCLLSLLMDNNSLFQYQPDIPQATNLTDNVFLQEKLFRDNVMNWLNNKKPKYFKSPAEGSFIVELLNVSSTPIDSLSRMLYSVNAQAVEIAENNIENLKRYNILNASEESLRKGNKNKTLSITKEKIIEPGIEGTITFDGEHGITLNHILFNNFPSGTLVSIGYTNQENSEIEINKATVYSINTPISNVHSISWPSVARSLTSPSIQYTYNKEFNAFKSLSQHDFNSVRSIQQSSSKVPIFKEFSNTSENIIALINNSLNNKETPEDQKIVLGSFNFLQFEKNDATDIDDDNNYEIVIDGEKTNINITGEYRLQDCANIKSITFGPKVKLTCAFDTVTIVYDKQEAAI